MEIGSSEGQLRDTPTVLPNQNLYVIVGGNNSGKSTFLREVMKTFPNEAYRVDVNRTILMGEGAQNKGYLNNIPSYMNDYRGQTDDNTQKNTQTLQDFFSLKDPQRAKVLDWYNQYFPNRIYEEREDKDNSASPMLLKVNGFSITKQGSGMRSTLEIFIKLFDPTIQILCIDEPEMGLEPYLQKYLFQAIKEKASNEKKIIIATHSHHFLDLETIENNFVCQRDVDGKIFLSPVEELEPVIFRLLGNTLSSFLLPERVLILEGPSDTTFLLRVLELAAKNDYSIHNSRGIGNITYAMQAITQFLRFNRAHLPVYNERVFVVVDKPGRDILVREWRNIVPDPRQVCTLSKNGIEYYYPERILQEVFNTTATAQQIIDGYLAHGETFNGITKTKVELSKVVASKIEAADLNDEQNELFIYIRTLP